MSRPRGFDPLSSLFDAPDPTFLPAALPPVTEEEEPSAPLSHLAHPVADPSYVPPPAAEPPVAPKVEAPPRLEVPVKAAPVAPPPPAPEPAPAPVDREAIARALAKAAAARVRDRAPSGLPAAEPPPPPEPPPPSVPVPAVSAPPRAPAPSSPAKGARRLEDIAPRPARPRDALSAARAAAEAEAANPVARPVAAAPRAASASKSLEARVGVALQQSLPSLGAVSVHRALLADDRGLLRPLWRAHRAKALSDGALDRAVGAVAVLQALDAAPAGALVAAHVVTEASDYLVWLDLSSGALVAAFSDARAWYSGGR